MVLLSSPQAHEAIASWCDPEPQELVKLTSRALPGLANLGNTCFANAVLQCLLNTRSLIKICSAFDQFRRPNKGLFGRSFLRLAKEYSSTAHSSVRRWSPALLDFRDELADANPQFEDYKQQDAYEFLGCVLEGLEESFQGHCGMDVIRMIFGITTHTRRRCHNCLGEFEVDRVTDTALRVPLLSPAAQFDAELRAEEEQTPISLQELLEATQRPETIEDYECDVCEGGVRSTITQHAGVLSCTREVVVVVLYRFCHCVDDFGGYGPRKVKRQVRCPSELRLETGTYQLYGVVSHIGSSLSAGHYVAAVRSMHTEAWYECDDERVTPLRPGALREGLPMTRVTPGAEPYMLFYQRRSSN
mmetsp:Transcript_53380/g.124250  ORF Transcript_53380/g.124250 Transcript_53380/m.124250 type:complete len:359 (-) Transcript_53380:72-1148(-)